jgi:hypothetical protein
MRNFDERPAPRTRLDHAAFETMVDDFIRDQLPSAEPASITYAAGEFERRADGLPDPQQAVVRRFAAALRERVARLRCH